MKIKEIIFNVLFENVVVMFSFLNVVNKNKLFKNIKYM